MARVETHECEAEGCREPVAKGMFMCIRHWRMVPKPLRDEVWAAYKAWRKGRRTVSLHDHLDIARQLREVHERAIAAVKEKELKKVAMRAEQQTSLGL